ncbi:cellulose binding domain-containing protein [Micromonospora marina]|uniref:cellulose binding domain-containing protein n=1 Tax=Micromonospora marina TaxID=307120 RepID=UPI003F504639
MLSRRSRLRLLGAALAAAGLAVAAALAVPGPASGAVTARNVSYSTVAPGGSVTIGFQATHTGNTGSPAAFTLNGSPCAVA